MSSAEEGPGIFKRLAVLAKLLGPKEERKIFKQAFREQFEKNSELRNLAIKFGRSAPLPSPSQAIEPSALPDGESVQKH